MTKYNRNEIQTYHIHNQYNPLTKENKWLMLLFLFVFLHSTLKLKHRQPFYKNQPIIKLRYLIIRMKYWSSKPIIASTTCLSSSYWEFRPKSLCNILTLPRQSLWNSWSFLKPYNFLSHAIQKIDTTLHQAFQISVEGQYVASYLLHQSR